MLPEMNRRRAIEMFAVGSAFSNAIGQAWCEPLVHELRPLSHIDLGILRVNLADYPALNQPLGSVRIGTSAMDATARQQLGLFPPVIINRAVGGALHVLSAACTHEGCIVRRLDAIAQRMICPCHGSQFAADGAVLQGPAQQPLVTHAFRERGTVLEIEMPGVFYEVTAKRAAAANRVEISFISFDKLTYEVYFLENFEAEPRRITFALSASGPLDRTEILGTDDYARLFVERPGTAGIFQIAMKAQAV